MTHIFLAIIQFILSLTITFISVIIFNKIDEAERKQEQMFDLSDYVNKVNLIFLF